MLLFWSMMQWIGDRVAQLAAADACHTFFVSSEGSFTVPGESTGFAPLNDVELSVIDDDLTFTAPECD